MIESGETSVIPTTAVGAKTIGAYRQRYWDGAATVTCQSPSRRLMSSWTSSPRRQPRRRRAATPSSVRFQLDTTAKRTDYPAWERHDLDLAATSIGSVSNTHPLHTGPCGANRGPPSGAPGRMRGPLSLRSVTPRRQNTQRGLHWGEQLRAVEAEHMQRLSQLLSSDHPGYWESCAPPDPGRGSTPVPRMGLGCCLAGG